jgi:hypothetical protein
VGSQIFDKAYINSTVLHPVAGIILAAMVLMMLGVQRRYAIWPLIVIACFIPQAQRIAIAGLDFTFLRIMVVFAVLRIMLWGEYREFKFTHLDLSVLVFALLRVVWGELFKSSGPAGPGVPAETGSMQKYGTAMDMLGMYFYFRCVVRDFDDLKSATYGFMWASIIVCATFVYEGVSGTNPFGPMRGVGTVVEARERDGVLRLTGAYSHPILAGIFWAAVLPYMGAFIKQKGRIHWLPLVAIACAGVTIILTGSSSPVMAAGVAFIGGCLFLVRGHIRLIRWCVFLGLVALQITMAKGAAHVLSRITIFGSSTGYYRFKLIDQFIANWKDWFLVGSKTGTANWDIPMYDIVNFYVILGLSGGITMLILITWVFNRAYKSAGQAMDSAGPDTEGQLIGWATGVAVCVHMISFLVVTYFGQVLMTWYFALAVTAIRSRAMGRGRNPIMTMLGRRADPLAQLAARPTAGWPPPVSWNRGQ